MSEKISPPANTYQLLIRNLAEFTKINLVDVFNLSRCRDRNSALIVVDAINGFCTPGCGPLAPPAQDDVIEAMICNIDTLARSFFRTHNPIIALCDCHDGPEPPYPDHCMRGTEEAAFVLALAWLERGASSVINKPCINGWIGAEGACSLGFDDKSLLENSLRNRLVEYAAETVVVTGICTDICVMQLVQSLLSARNAGLLPALKNVVVDVSACATYDLPIEACRSLGLPETAAHPRELFHYLGLLMMQQSGAILAGKVAFK